MGDHGTGYRIYSEIHLRSALAYRALARGAGPVEAKRIVRAAHEHPTSKALALLDAAHARLGRDASIAARSRALLDAAAALSAVVSPTAAPPP